MEIRGKHLYSQSVDELFQAFGSPEMITRKLESLGAKEIKLSRCELTESRLEIDLDRKVPAEVPGMLKKFLGEWNHVSQKESWTGTPGQGYQCQVEVHIDGVPVKISGTMRIAPEAGGSSNEVVFTISCGIPLVGKKLAEFVAHSTEQAMEQEYQFIKHYLG